MNYYKATFVVAKAGQKYIHNEDKKVIKIIKAEDEEEAEEIGKEFVSHKSNYFDIPTQLKNVEEIENLSDIPEDAQFILS